MYKLLVIQTISLLVDIRSHSTASVTNQDESTSVTSVSPSSDILTTGISRKRKYTVAGLLGEGNEKMDYKNYIHVCIYIYKPWTIIAHSFFQKSL